jgi:hypothetical protein
MLGDLAEAEEHARRAVALAKGMADPAIEAQTLGDLGFIELLRGKPGFQAKLTRAVALEAADADRAQRGWSRWLDVRTRFFDAVALGWTDQLDASRAAFLELRALAEELGHEHAMHDLLNWLGRLECFEGRWQAGLALASEGDEAAVQAELPVSRPYVLATIALANAHLGNVDAARAAIAEGIGIAERLEIVPGRLELLVAEGFLELSLGRSAEAQATAKPGCRPRFENWQLPPTSMVVPQRAFPPDDRRFPWT